MNRIILPFSRIENYPLGLDIFARSGYRLEKTDFYLFRNFIFLLTRSEPVNIF